jgi:hypothetical protein
MKTRETDNGDKIIRGEKKRGKEGHIEKRIEHMLTHFLSVVHMYHFFFSFSFIFQGALTHATIHRELTMKYKLESVGKKRKEN